MKGFTYPGESPLRGKQKTADLAAATERGDSATDQWKEAMSTDVESTDLMKGNDPKYGEVPFQKRAPLKSGAIPTQPAQQLPVDMGRGMTTNAGYAGNTNSYTAPAPKTSFGESFKAAMGTEIGQAAGKALVEGGIKLGVNALVSDKKKNTKKTVNVASGFSQMNITGRS